MYILMSYLYAMRAFIARHRALSVLAVCVIVGGGGAAYAYLHGEETETRYILGTVETGSIVATVSGSGQIVASEEAEIRPKVSGDITSIRIKSGQRVTRGQVIATIDATDARQALTNARLDLDAARLTLERDTSQAPIDSERLDDALTEAREALADEYDAIYTSISDAFIALPAVMSESDNLLYDSDLSVTAQNISYYQNLFISADDTTRRLIQDSATRADQDYDTARDAYTDVYARFKKISRSTSAEDLETMLADTESTLLLVSQSLTSTVNLIDAVVDQIERRNWTMPAGVPAQQTSARAQLTDANAALSAVAAQSASLRTKKKAVTTAAQDVELAAIGNPSGSDPFELQLQRNEVQKMEAAVREAEQALADHTVYAPFDGVIASIDADLYDAISSTAAIATIISDGKTASLSLNEVDATAVSLGDSVSLTFDALENLELAGTVSEIDARGTVSQGVVSYTVKIALEGDDERIKPGMTVNADIVSDSRDSVLRVPSSAVKSNPRGSYVLVFANEYPTSREGVVTDEEPTQVMVETGIADTESVEIISGLSEGQQIIVRTTGATPTTTAAPSGGFRGPGGGIRL